MRFLSLLAVAALSPLATSQTAIVVPSASYPTIQSGIDAAANGQIVRVLAGTYKENIDLKNKDITLVALIGPAATIIDGGQNGITVTIAGGQTRKCLIEGFTVTGGIGTSSLIGGGFHIKGSSPTIRNCIVRGNTNPAYGAGIGLTGSGTSSPTEPLIEDCQILDNVAGGATGLSYASGGGIAGGTSYDRNNPDTPIVRNCHFEGNEASSRGGGIYASYGFGFLIEACTFTRNRTLSGTGLAGGSAIFMSLNSPFTVVNCRVWGNESPSTGSAVKFFNTAGGVVVNSTITANSGGGIGGYNNGGAFGANTTLDVFNSIIWQNGGHG
jgi:predicted outer membrane repeat protein